MTLPPRRPLRFPSVAGSHDLRDLLSVDREREQDISGIRSLNVSSRDDASPH